MKKRRGFPTTIHDGAMVSPLCLQGCIAILCEAISLRAFNTCAVTALLVASERE